MGDKEKKELKIILLTIFIMFISIAFINASGLFVEEETPHSDTKDTITILDKKTSLVEYVDYFRSGGRNTMVGEQNELIYELKGEKYIVSVDPMIYYSVNIGDVLDVNIENGSELLTIAYYDSLGNLEYSYIYKNLTKFNS